MYCSNDCVSAALITPPATTELIYSLRQEGFDLPLEALTVGECADAVMAAIKKAGGQ